jgi:hypothetical protein
MPTPEELLKLAQALRFIPGSEGFFDACGGVIHINRPRETYDQLAGSTFETLSPESDALLQLIMHERLHLLQTCTFGFSYAFASDLYIHTQRYFHPQATGGSCPGR